MSAPSLLPREHGAYGQLLLPLATALASGRPGAAAWLLAFAVAAAFLAHEPLLVVLGRRGERARAGHGARARRRLGLLASVTVVAGVSALASAGAGTGAGPGTLLPLGLGAALPLGLGALLLAFIDRGQERTTAGETLAAATLAAAGVPVALAGGVPPPQALGAWLAWALAFAATTAAVRAVIAVHKGRAVLVETHLLLAASAAWAAAVAFGLSSVAAALPLLSAGWLLRLRPPDPHHLNRVGWSLLAASLATAGLLVSWPRV